MKRAKTGMNQDTVQEMNRSLLLHLLREEGLCSRSVLAQRSGLKQATVTNIVADFVQWGLVKEVGYLSGSKGRRSIGISINTDVYRVVGVRLAREYFTVGLYDLTGMQTRQVRVETDANALPSEVFEDIIAQIATIIAGEEAIQVLAIGMAIPGPFIRHRGRIALMTEAYSWNDMPLRERLEERFQIPVFLEHDANAGALAQMWSMKKTSNASGECVLAYVAAGQGVGAGIIVNGELVRGAIGTAGEIGHTLIDMNGPQCACGNRGCLEKYCSSIAFRRSVNAHFTDGDKLSYAEMIQKAQMGDMICVSEYRKAMAFLGVGLVNLIYSYNPDVLIVGDEMADILPEVLLETLQETVRGRILPEIYDNMHIGLSKTCSEASLCGAAIVGIQEIFRSPLNFITV